jgi:hypothetical protein
MATFRPLACLIRMSRTCERCAPRRRRSWSAAALGCVGLLGATVSCTTTLDPSFVVAGGDGGVSDPLPTCSSFAQAPSSYVVCSKPLNFAAASSDCLRRGATLAGMGSGQENEFVATNAGNVVNDDAWLGGTRDDSYVWRWPDGTIFWRGGPDGAPEGDSFVRWLPGEPNDSSTVTTDPERCLALKFNQNDWNDRACSLELPYVCEQSLPAP